MVIMMFVVPARLRMLASTSRLRPVILHRILSGEVTTSPSGPASFSIRATSCSKSFQSGTSSWRPAILLQNLSLYHHGWACSSPWAKDVNQGPPGRRWRPVGKSRSTRRMRSPYPFAVRSCMDRRRYYQWSVLPESPYPDGGQHQAPDAKTPLTADFRRSGGELWLIQ